MKREFEFHQRVERSILTTYRKEIWKPFILAVKRYELIQAGDKIAVGVSGGKDSLVTLTALARLSKFYQKPFKVVAITVETGVPGMNFDAVADYCEKLGVEYIRVDVPIYEIVFLERKEKNPCSLCAKLRRGALSTAMNEHGIKTTSSKNTPASVMP